MSKRIGIGYSFKEESMEKENEKLKKQIDELNLKLSKKEAKKAKEAKEEKAKEE